MATILPVLNPNNYKDLKLTKSHSKLIQDIISELNNNIKNEYTLKTYSTNLRSLDKIFEFKLLDSINNTEYVINKILQYSDTPRNYFNILTTLCLYSKLYKSIIKEENNKIYHSYMINYNKIDKSKLTDVNIIKWHEIITMKSNFLRGTQAYILYILYTMIPPVRDNYGQVKIVQFYNKDDPSDQYATETKQIVLKNYKTFKTYSDLVLNLPENIYTEIDYFLSINNNKYLITQDNGNIYKNGKIANKIKTLLGISVNEFRHSFSTFVHYFPERFSIEEVIFINKVMGHSADLALRYVRDVYTDKEYNLSIVKDKYHGDDPKIMLESVSNKMNNL